MTRTKTLKRRYRGPIVAAIAAAALMTGVGLTSAATASTRHVTRPASAPRPASANAVSPAVAVAVTAQHQEFNSNTNGFCNNRPGGSNAPCDGNPGDYGTIDRVPTGFSNGGGGNYAPSTPAYFDGFFALTSGSGATNQGVGCTDPSVEACSGPYMLFGSPATSPAAETVFPHNGFTVTNDLYLDPSTAPAGGLVDDDVALNTSSGDFGIDNVISACPQSGGTGFTINFGNGSPGSCAGTPVITTKGWYRFVFVFSNTAGFAYVTEFVLDESNSLAQVATNGPEPVGGGAATHISTWGGPRYFWLPTENVSGLPIANVAVQTGSHPTGYTPPPPTP